MDSAARAALIELVACSPEQSAAALLQRASEVAERMSIAEAFRERLLSDQLELGVAKRAVASAAGLRLAELEVELYERADTPRDTVIRARVRLCHSAQLHFSFDADEVLGVACFEVRGGAEFTAPSLLLRIRAVGRGPRRARVRIDVGALMDLETAHLRTSLELPALIHVTSR
jgi:hypothetical protein